MWIALYLVDTHLDPEENVLEMIPPSKRTTTTPTVTATGTTPPASEREPYVGLRLRLWLACVSGGAIAGLGTLWVLGTRVQPGAAGAGELQGWLAGVAFAAVGSGMLVALWLDHHIVGHLRGLLRGLRSGRVVELRGLPASAGWGELTELTDLAQSLLVRQRLSANAAQELDQVRGQLATLHITVEQWLRTEKWDAPSLASGPLAGTAEMLARGFARRGSVDEQNAQAARQVASELVAALADATESAEQAERGFVEATAMLTTVRELQRLSGELQGALNAMGTPVPPAAREESGAREAIEILVEASRASVESIGHGILGVQDVSALVQQLANRTTLVALHAVTASHGGERLGTDLGEELRQLVHEVREATDRTSQLAFEVENAVTQASERMRGARERAMEHLAESGAAPAAPPSPRAYDDSQRLLERVREMVQDATRKGERLSAAGERSSRAAERLARRVAEESSEAQALVVRMTPVGAAAVPAPPAPPAPPAHELRLLEESPGETAGAEDEPGVRGEKRP